MRQIFLALAAFCLSACAQNGAPIQTASDNPALVAEGRRLAEIHCARCHAIGVEGESRHPMAPPFRTLSRNYPVGALEEAFAEGVLVGHPDMPEFEFEPRQVDAVVAYLQSVQERRGG